MERGYLLRCERNLRLLTWFMIFSSASVLYAQERDHTEITPDTALRSSARIDPSTLAMSIQIPLGNYPGRAGNSLPVVLTYSSKVWGINYTDTRYNEITGQRLYDFLDSGFGQHSVAGWTSSFSIPRIVWHTGEKYNSSGTPGKCGPGVTGSPVCYYISRLDVFLPDGSSHELRKDDVARTTFDQTGTFYAVDRSRLKFEASTNTLWMPDGARLIFNSTNQFYEKIATQYIDRNGNVMNIDPASRQWTDTLGRVLADPLPVGPAPGGMAYEYDANRPAAGDQNYALPGVGGTPKNYILRWRQLADVLTPDPATGQVPPLRYRGNYTLNGNSLLPSPYLFQGSANYRIAVEQVLFNPVVLHEIVLPNGSMYRFTYNEYGEINKITYPTGGYERFEYSQIQGLRITHITVYGQANRGVIKRWLSPTGLAADEQLWQYSSSLQPSYYLVTTTAPDNTRTERYLHRSPYPLYFDFDDARVGMAFDERAYSAANVLLRRSLTQWTVSGPTPGGQASATRDARVTKAVNILLDTGGDALTSATTTIYDGDLNPIATNEYDYATIDPATAQTAPIDSIPIPAQPVRINEATFLVNDTNIDIGVRTNYRDRHLIALPSSSRVKDGNGNIVAQKLTSYDETALQNFGGTTGWVDPQTSYRGNATTSRSWLNTSNSYLSTQAQYDQFGNVRSTTDARGNQSQID